MIERKIYKNNTQKNKVKYNAGVINNEYIEKNKKYEKELEDNQSIVNISVVIEAAMESSFQFWFQTIYLMPTIFISFMDVEGGGSKLSDLLNWRVFSIVLSFGTFSWTFCSIEY